MRKTLLRGLIGSLVMLITVLLATVFTEAVGASVEAVAVSSDSVKLCWISEKNSDGYIIESYENGKWNSRAEITDSKLSAYIIRGLKSGTAYYFRVKYYTVKNNAKQYYSIGGAIRCITAIPRISGFSGATGTDSVRLTWHSPGDCDGYELQRLSGTKWVTLGKLTPAGKNRITVRKLKSDREYDFRIRAYKSVSSEVIYSPYSYLTCNTTDKKSIKLFGPNMVYTGESFDYTYCFEGYLNGEIKWSVMGSGGKIDEKGSFTALKQGKSTIIATDKNGGLRAILNVHCVDSAENVSFLPLVNGINIANKTYPVPESYDPKGLTIETRKAFEAMRKGALKEGISLRSISGYRSYARQVANYKYWKEGYGEYADSFSAKPGFSEHQLGLAIDVNDMWASFADTKEGKWLEENCYKYGFILRYPSYGSEISTGYEYEPWHIRYVGKKLAKKLHFSGSTLEEYLGIDSYYR